MGVIVTSFCNKGGVGKTTFLYNFACELQDQGQRVLLIDADAQMNLTSLIFRLSTSVEYVLSHDVDKILNKWLDTINEYLTFPEFITNGIEKIPNNKKFYRYNENDLNSKPELDLSPMKGESLQMGYIDFMSSGSYSLHKLELDITQHVLSPNNSLSRSTPYLVQLTLDTLRKDYDLVQLTLDTLRKDYDFILIDTSPSFSVLNGLLIMCSDYFFTPIRPDFFSLQSIDNLPHIFNTWDTMLSDFKPTNEKYGINIRVKYLGAPVQMMKKYNTSEEEKYAITSQKWVTELNSRIKKACSAIRDTDNRVVKPEIFQQLFPQRIPYIMGEFYLISEKMLKVAEFCKIPVIHITEQTIANYNMYHEAGQKVSGDNTNQSYGPVIEVTKEYYRNLATSFINNIKIASDFN